MLRKVLGVALCLLVLTGPALADSLISGGHRRLPPLDIAVDLDRHDVAEGEAICVRVSARTHRLDRVTVSGPGGTMQLFDRGEFVGWYPIPLGTRPGRHDLHIEVLTRQRTVARLRVPMVVAAGDFPDQHLVATAQMIALTRQTERIADDRRALTAAYARPAYLDKLGGPIVQPTTGRISTAFGERRFTNGVLTGHHQGIDVATPAGQPVLAAADGIVKLADALVLQGNTVIIDHGLGLYSLYYHLRDIDVVPGQLVRQGQVIGTVGSTGYSTGPHLHWSLAVRSTVVDPEPFCQDRHVRPRQFVTGDRP